MLFAAPWPFENGDEDRLIMWEVWLDTLANAAEAGCQFCSFMACRFFNDSAMILLFGIVSSPVVGCCSQGKYSPPGEDVRKAIEHLREQSRKFSNPSVTLLALRTRDRDSKKKTDKIKFVVGDTTMPDGVVAPLLGFRIQIDLEFHALNGT